MSQRISQGKRLSVMNLRLDGKHKRRITKQGGGKRYCSVGQMCLTHARRMGARQQLGLQRRTGVHQAVLRHNYHQHTKRDGGQRGQELFARPNHSHIHSGHLSASPCPSIHILESLLTGETEERNPSSASALSLLTSPTDSKSSL